MILECEEINLKGILRFKNLDSWTLQDYLYFYDLPEKDRLYIQGTREQFQINNAYKI